MGRLDHLREAWRQDRQWGIRLLLYKHRQFRKRRLSESRALKNWKETEPERKLREMEEQALLMKRFPTEMERKEQAARNFTHRVTFLIPTWNTDPKLLKQLAYSLTQQTCGQWEAVFYDGASNREETRQALREIREQDSRIHVAFGEKNLGISGNTNKALELVRTDCVALCDHDDLLTCDAAYRLLDAFEKGADFCYSDEDSCDAEGNLFFDTHRKGGFAPDCLRSVNYICHLMAMTTELMRRAGGLRSECDGSQDHDLALRATEIAKCILHIPHVLYHWRMVNTSFSHTAAESCANAAARAVGDQLARLGLEGKVRLERLRPYIEFPIPEETRVSLIVHGTQGTVPVHWLYLLLENTGEDAERIGECIEVCERLQDHVPFRARNLGIQFLRADSLWEAAEKATGDVLLFLEAGMLPRESAWLHRGLMMATRPWVGQTGGGILNRDFRYLASGYAVDAALGAVGCLYGENALGYPYHLYHEVVRDVSAVSACYLMIRKAVFQQYQRFSEYDSDLGSVALGLDCMRNHLYNVIVPWADMRQAGKTRLLRPGKAPEDLERFRKAYKDCLTEEFYFGPPEREGSARRA